MENSNTSKDEIQLSRQKVRDNLAEILELFELKPQRIKTISKDKTIKQPIVDPLHVLIDEIRLCTKYILLDNESFKRENKYLRKLLEENG